MHGLTISSLDDGIKNEEFYNLMYSMKKQILYITQSITGYKANCGVGQIGNLLGQTLKQHQLYDFNLLYADSIAEVISHLELTSYSYDAIIYNYHPGSVPWMANLGLRKSHPHIKHIRIWHDSNIHVADQWINKTVTPPKLNDNPNSWNYSNDPNWEYLLMFDPTVQGNDYVFITNRIIPNCPTVEYTELEKPIIGFQGFGFAHKGIEKIAHQVVKEFDEAIIRLHIPNALYGDSLGHNAQARVEAVRKIVSKKPGIEVVASFDMMDIQTIINVLAQNTINCYFYDYVDGAGLSSSIDFALAARRPIASSKSHQMRHLWNLTPSILIEQKSLKEIIAQGTTPLEQLYIDYSVDSVLNDYTKMLQKLFV